MITEVAKPYMCQIYKSISFSSEQEEMIQRIAFDYTLSKEFLIKKCLDLVTKMAYWYARENNKPLMQMLEIGKTAALNATRQFNNSGQIDFMSFVSQEILKAMIEVKY